MAIAKWDQDRARRITEGPMAHLGAYRRPIELRAQGLTFQEMAHELGVGVGKARTVYLRALRCHQLRQVDDPADTRLLEQTLW